MGIWHVWTQPTLLPGETQQFWVRHSFLPGLIGPFRTREEAFLEADRRNRMADRE